MKFIITESKLENIIFKYLDNQDFVKIEGSDYVYFSNSSDDEYAEIKYDKNDGCCYIYFGLRDEISDFFYLSSDDSKELIGKWVENTLQMKVTKTTDAYMNIDQWLKTPWK